MNVTLLISILAIGPWNNTIKDSDHLDWVGFSLRPRIQKIVPLQREPLEFQVPADDRTVALAEAQALKEVKPVGPDGPENDTVSHIDMAFVRGRKVTERQHWDWFRKQLQVIKKVKVGMTRQDLFKMVATEGGLSTRSQQTFVGMHCPELKIDVKFRSQSGDSSMDQVSFVSIPHIDFSVMD